MLGGITDIGAGGGGGTVYENCKKYAKVVKYILCVVKKTFITV